MKNMHLLGVLVGLGLLSAMLCFLLVVRENSNSRRLDEFTGELQQSRESHQAREDQLAREVKARQDQMAIEITQVRKDLLLAQEAAANASRTDLKSAGEQLSAVQRDLTQVSKTLAGFQRKEWLAQSGDEPPWKAEIKSLTDKLDELTNRVKELEGKLKKEIE
jgi:hypothetical protein